MPRITVNEPGGKNVEAFLDMLAISELGSQLIALSDDGYNVIVGSTADNLILFPTLPSGLPDYSKHPDEYEKAFDSTAAGRYQEIYGNYVAYKVSLNLPDFSPVSQDLIAIQLIHEVGAYQGLLTGAFTQAISKCASRWASLPGGTSGQHQHAFDQLQGWYYKAGGACNA